MKIDNIDPKSIVWRKSTSSQYSEIYKRVEAMQIGEVLRVELDEVKKFFAGALTTSFRKRKSDFMLRTMKEDKEGKIWIIAKLKRKNKKHNEVL